MDDCGAVCALAGGSLAIGTVALAVAGGPILAVGLFGSLAAFGIISAVTGG